MTGKTLASIAVVGRAYLNGKMNRVLVVAPASVCPVWKDEFEKYAAFPVEVRVLEGERAQRLRALQAEWPDNKLLVAVINYESLWRLEEELIKWQPDCLILDEMQRVKSPGAKQSKSAAKFGKVCRYRLGLTGTPVNNGMLDVYGEYRALDQSIFGTSFVAFRSRYAIMGGYQNHQVIGYRNQDELIRKAHSIAFRCTKAEALDLPEQVDQTLYCELAPDERARYRQLAKESVLALQNEETLTAANVLTRMLRLSQFTGGFIKDGDYVEQVSSSKLNLLDETLTDLLDAGQKVVIFARFLPEIDAIKRMLEKKRVGYEWITGARAMNERGDAVAKFQSDPACKVFVAQIQAAGLGITLTAASTDIFYSLDFSFANYDQCRARLHRLSQKNNVTHIHLIAKGTVDTRIMAALKDKRDVATMVVDNWREWFK